MSLQVAMLLFSRNSRHLRSYLPPSPTKPLIQLHVWKWLEYLSAELILASGDPGYGVSAGIELKKQLKRFAKQIISCLVSLVSFPPLPAASFFTPLEGIFLGRFLANSPLASACVKQASLDKHSQLDVLYKSSPTSFKRGRKRHSGVRSRREQLVSLPQQEMESVRCVTDWKYAQCWRRREPHALRWYEINHCLFFLKKGSH